MIIHISEQLAVMTPVGFCVYTERKPVFIRRRAKMDCGYSEKRLRIQFILIYQSMEF